MKFPLFLLALAALLLWGAHILDGLQAEAPIVAAERRQAAPAPATPNLRGPRVRDAAMAPPVTALFRPAAIPAEAQAPRPGETFALVGLVGAGANAIALVRDEADGVSFRVRLNEEVRGWVLASLDQRCALLRRRRQQQTLCVS